MNTDQEKPQGESLKIARKHRILLGVFAVITLVGFVYVFGVFDSFTTKILSDPKDYKAEEQANMEYVKTLNKRSYDKLVDETAEQFVNEIEEEEIDTVKIVEEIIPEPEPEGEEF